MKNYILEVNNLTKHFDIGRGQKVQAVNNVSFHVRRGETFGLVGESGCGKTTIGRTIMGLYQKTSGEVLYNGDDIHALTGRERNAFLRQMQMIFQDPYASLNPRSTVREIIAEPMQVHKLYDSDEEINSRIYELMEEVGLNRDHVNRYPHEFSGGQRQRI